MRARKQFVPNLLLVKTLLSVLDFPCILNKY
jgi:hypothetical protein